MLRSFAMWRFAAALPFRKRFRLRPPEDEDLDPLVALAERLRERVRERAPRPLERPLRCPRIRRRDPRANDNNPRVAGVTSPIIGIGPIRCAMFHLNSPSLARYRCSGACEHEPSTRRPSQKAA